MLMDKYLLECREIQRKCILIEIMIMDFRDELELDQSPAHSHIFFTVYEFLPQVSGNIVEMDIDILDSLIFLDQVRCFFGSDSGDSFDIIGAIPYQSQVIKDVLRFESELLDKGVGRSREILHGIHAVDIWSQKLFEIFISGIDRDDKIRICLMSLDQGRDDIISLIARHDQAWDTELIDDLFGDRELMLEVVIHLLAISLVVRILLMPQGLDRRIPGNDEIVRLFLEDPHEHTEKTIDNIDVMAILIHHRRERVICSIEKTRSIYQKKLQNKRINN